MEREERVLIVYVSMSQLKSDILNHMYSDLITYFQKKGMTSELYRVGQIDSEETLCRELTEYVKKNGISLVLLGSRLFRLVGERLSVPVIEIRRSFYDYYRAIRALGEKRSQAVMILWGPLRPGEKEYIEELRELIPLILLETEERSEIQKRKKKTRQVIRQCKEQGYTTIIGVGMVYDIALEEGMAVQIIGFHSASLFLAVREALYQYRLFDQEKENLRSLRSIFREVEEGILVSDEEGNILEVNSAARSIFKGIIPERCRIEELFPLEQVQEAIRKEEEISHLVCRVQEKTLMLTLRISRNESGKRFHFIFYPSAVVRAMEREIQADMRKRGYIAKNTFSDIRSASSSMEMLKRKARRYAVTESTVVIYGESGTGKELFAQSIHNESSRKQFPFVAVNCGALPENLLESELFGYVKGAFTGARAEGKKGIFEIAHRGTLFLDEIGELPLSMQARLLRVLQEREVVRLGDDKVISVDVRILAATNRNLYEAVQEGRFREDLYYRLNVLPLRVPSLRERREDIPIILADYLRTLGNEKKHLNAEALRECMNYSWPGNVRELKNFAERIALLSETDEIGREMVLQALEIELNSITAGSNSKERKYAAMCLPGESISDDVILEMLKKNGGSRKLTAEELGISTTTLWRRLKAMSGSERK